MELDKKIAFQLEELNMPAVIFKTAHQLLGEGRYCASGIDEMEFLVSTNPGQPPKPLAKIASGGELSRISLAIQVITAQNSSTPTLTFDEVDVGIGGATAEVVGNLLRSLGEKGQIICVTHQAQVAVYGHHHLRVSKHNHTDQRASQIVELSGTERVEEIARMMGGIKITDQTKAHAHEMLATASH
jgi:DNA repair protein RecN (Recombination protein N)